MTVNRRRSRGARVTVAVTLLAVTGLLLIPALAIGERLLLASAAVLGWLAGVAAARLLSDEHVRTRREAAHDRAVQARLYVETFAARAHDHDVFAATMTGRVAARDAEITRLQAGAQHAAARLDEAHAKLRDESARANSLQAAVTRLEARVSELSDDLDEQKTLASESLAFWYGRHDPTVEELLAWEGRAGSRTEPIAREA